MSLEFTYEGAAFAVDVKPSTVSIPSRAENGDTGNGLIPFEDPDGLVAVVGHRTFVVEESACSQPRLFTGWTVERDYGRDPERGLLVGPQRLTETNIVDANAAAGFRLISGDDGNRPSETWNDRLAWIVGSDYLGPLIGGDTTFFGSYTQMMDAADYRTQTPGSVLEDLCERTGGVLNWFLFWNPDTSAIELFIKREEYTIGDCTLSISNVESDVDGIAVFFPDDVAKLQREPDQVYSEVIVEYNGGRVFRSRPSTEAAFNRRGTTINRPYTKSATTAQAQAEQWLDAHSYERDRITCIMRSVPAASVGLIQAGMGLNVKFTHMPGYETSTTMRIVMCSPVPVSDLGDLYDVSLELLNSRPAEGCECLPYDDGELTIGPIDISTPERNWMASLTVPAHCSVTIDRYEWVGYTNPTQYPPYFVFGWWEAEVWDPSYIYPGRTSGVVTTTLGANLGYDSIVCGWAGNGANTDPVSGPVMSTATYEAGQADSGEVFVNDSDEDVPLYFNSTVDPQYGATGSYTFTAVYHCGPGGSDDTEVDLGNLPGEVHTDTADPTQDDDADDGYVVGQLWVNTDTGGAWILVDATPGAAVWTPLGGSLALDDLTDVNAPSPADGDGLVWVDGAGEWQPVHALTTEDVVAIITPDITFCDSLTVIDSDGVIAAGTHTDLHAVGGTTVEIEEVTGAPGIHVQAAFSGLDGITNVYVNGYYTATHTVTVDLYNYDTTNWDTVITLGTSQTSMQIYSAAIADGSPYIDYTGDALLRFYHADSGNITHRLYLDYLALSHVAGGAGALALDDLSDVNAPSPDDGDVLTWDDGTSAWVAAAPTGSGDVATDSIWDAKGDLAVGTGANTAARLAVAANGASLIAASGETTGLKWQLNKLDATAAPGTGDDSNDGYSVGSIWIDVSGDDAYICVDASVGAAVWNPFEGTPTNWPNYASEAIVSGTYVGTTGIAMMMRAGGYLGASAAYITANKAFLFPFVLADDATATQIGTYNGASAAGNIDVGIYSSSGTLLVSSGSTAQSGTNAAQMFNIADTALTGGTLYYLAISCDSTSATFIRDQLNAVYLAGWGILTKTASFPLPSPISGTSVMDANYVPWVWVELT